jgi:GntR family transcriptional regulator
MLQRDEDAGKTKPVYVRIQDYLLDLIGGPDYGPGDRVPSERTLAETLGVNRMTVRKAIDKLVERGVLERNSTSGTRIPLPQVARPIDSRQAGGIARVVLAAGGHPGNKLLHFGMATATDTIAARLKVPVGTELLMCRRLWTVNDVPFCIETSWLPADRFPDLVAEDLVAGQSLYALLRARYDVEAKVSEREISAGPAAELEARLLGLEPGSPTLVMRLVARDADGRPVEYMKSVNHPAHVVFRAAPPA